MALSTVRLQDRPQAVGRLLVISCGNTGRGDDGLGSAALGCVQRLILLSPVQGVHIDTDETDQLQIECVLDLVNADLVLVLDAAASGRGPYRFERVHPRKDLSYTTHALSPAGLLYLFGQLTAELPPPLFLLSIRGYRFAPGTVLSERAFANLSGAEELLQVLLRRPELGAWDRLTGPAARRRIRAEREGRATLY